GLFYLPIYEHYGKQDSKRGDAFLTQILNEEGITIEWTTSLLNENNAGGFVLASTDKEYFHIGLKNKTGGWNAKHGYWKKLVNGGTLNQAASLYDSPDPLMRIFYFIDKRPNQQYTGISIDIHTIRNNSNSTIEFWNKVLLVINSLL